MFALDLDTLLPREHYLELSARTLADLNMKKKGKKKAKKGKKKDGGKGKMVDICRFFFVCPIPTSIL